MTDLLRAALQFPTVVFSVLVVLCVGYWVVSMFASIDSEVLDLDTDGGFLDDALDDLHIAGVPPAVVLTLVSVFAWFASFVAMRLLPHPRGAAFLALAVGVGAGALVLGALVAAVVARPMRRLFAHAEAMSRDELVGQVCTVRTGSVTRDFGQAEVRVAEGGSVIVQVRSDEVANGLHAGDSALIFKFDGDREAFLVTPVDDDLV